MLRYYFCQIIVCSMILFSLIIICGSSLSIRKKSIADFPPFINIDGTMKNKTSNYRIPCSLLSLLRSFVGFQELCYTSYTLLVNMLSLWLFFIVANFLIQQALLLTQSSIALGCLFLKNRSGKTQKKSRNPQGNLERPRAPCRPV